MIRRLVENLAGLVLMAFVVLTRPMLSAVASQQDVPVQDRIIFCFLIITVCYLILGYMILVAVMQKRPRTAPTAAH